MAYRTQEACACLFLVHSTLIAVSATGCTLPPGARCSHGYMSCGMGRTLTHSACCDHHMQGAVWLMVVTFKFLLDTQMQASWRLSSQLPAYTHGTLAS